jgi:hypothetical protein
MTTFEVRNSAMYGRVIDEKFATADEAYAAALELFEGKAPVELWLLADTGNPNLFATLDMATPDTRGPWKVYVDNELAPTLTLEDLP